MYIYIYKHGSPECCVYFGLSASFIAYTISLIWAYTCTISQGSICGETRGGQLKPGGTLTQGVKAPTPNKSSTAISRFLHALSPGACYTYWRMWICCAIYLLIYLLN